jgi:hypothetical protein
MGPSTLTSWALLIHRALTARAIDSGPLFRSAGLDPERMEDPNARYPVAQMQRLWALAIAATGDECFGLEVAQAWHPTTFHALGYSALASETLREALSRAARYSQVVTTGARLELQQSGEEVMVRVVGTLPEQRIVPASMDAGIASLVILCREGRGGEIDPVRVRLTRPSSICAERLQTFFGCPIDFGATENGVVFSAADLDAHLSTANPVLLRVNEQVVTEYVARLDRSEITVQVQAKLIQVLPTGKVGEASMARALNLSSAEPATQAERARDDLPQSARRHAPTAGTAISQGLDAIGIGDRLPARIRRGEQLFTRLQAMDRPRTARPAPVLKAVIVTGRRQRTPVEVPLHEHILAQDSVHDQLGRRGVVAIAIRVSEDVVQSLRRTARAAGTVEPAERGPWQPAATLQEIRIRRPIRSSRY